MAKHSILEVFEKNVYPFKMLVVGETGSGKTSFLNLLYNCDKVQQNGCKFDEAGMKHFQQFHDSSLENDKGQKMASKTSGTKLYKISFGKIDVGIIDTPGFGDSRGLKQDEKNVGTIIKKLREEDYINCVCLVINGRTARANAVLQYVLTEITAMMPQTILNNVVVVFTNSRKKMHVNFDQSKLSTYFGRQPKHIFYIDNPYSLYQKMKEEGKNLAEMTGDLEDEFDHAADVLKNMFKAIHEFAPVHTQSFTELYDKKQAIEDSVLELLTEHDNQVRFENKLKVAEKRLVAAQSIQEFYKNYEKEEIPFWKPYDTSYHNTLCNHMNCHSNCHEYCHLPKSLDPIKFKQCACMGPGEEPTCKECGHSYKNHYHGYKLYRLETPKPVIDAAMKKRYDDAKTDEEKQQGILNGLQQNIVKSLQERKRLSGELFQRISEFEQVAVLRNYSKLVENQLAVIDTRIKGTDEDDDIDMQYLRDTREELAKKLMQLKQH